MRRGDFPWNAGTTIVPGKLLDELMEQDAPQVIALLRAQAKKQMVRKRLIWQFNDKQLDDIVQEASEKEGSIIVSIVDDPLCLISLRRRTFPSELRKQMPGNSF